MFKKIAKVPIIAVAEGKFTPEANSISFTKSASQKAASYYQANSGKLDIRGMLKLVAKDYDISDDPHDYIFEAVRACTAEVPNENGDAFPRDELLRFDHRLGKAVYQTFIGKPHHINHRADNPKHSRGVVLDASYNDMSPALENCPECDTRTASAEGRDKTGVNCVKCGHTVKDEFVELLLAVDTRKDPTFADGVRTGSLDSLSMGCEAGYTDCSICDNRARSVHQFCQHIKSGNKKKMFKAASGRERMSYEKCGEVVFTEISRVDQPADPTAKQREIFQVSAFPVEMESEMLVMASKIAKLEQMIKIASPTGMPFASNQPFMLGDEVVLLDDHEPIKQGEVGKVVDVTEANDTIIVAFQDKGNLTLANHPGSPLRLLKRVRAQLDMGGPKLVDEVTPQVPFKNLAESIKWAEASAHKLKAEISRLTSEKQAKHKEASDAGRPFYAWENAAYDAQIKANRQYVARLEDYVAKAREMQAAGTPWEKGLTRQMSRFFAEKQAQMLNEIQKDVQDQLEPLKVMHPELAPVIDQLSGQDTIPGPMSIDDYAKKHEESFDQKISPAEMGMKPEEGGAPLPMSASKIVEKKIASELDALIDSVKESNVSSKVTALKFADSYKDLEANVTKGGNVQIRTKEGTLFVVRPEVKPQDKAAAEKVAAEVLSHIGNFGLVATVQKYETVIGPKMGQILEHHLEDFDGGREEGDKGPVTEGGETDGTDKEREKPAKSVVEEETTDRKDEKREKRDQSNADVLEEHQPDHKEKLDSSPVKKGMPEGGESDGANSERGTPSKDTQKDLIVDFKDKSKKPKGTDKSAQMAPPAPMPSPTPAAPTGPGPAMAAGDMCACMPGKCACGPECAKCDPAMSKCGCPCGAKMAQGIPPAPAPGAMPMAAMSKEATKQYVSRIERLYRARHDKMTKESAEKVAAAEQAVAKKVAAKFLRALKLAAKRQALNLEFSPIKASLHDVLTSQRDLDAESYYPGMDAGTAAHIVEATTEVGFEGFVDSLVKRAADFVNMNDEAFTALEADVQNLQPAPIAINVQASKRTASRQDVRAAAVKGNLALAPAPTTEAISDVDSRSNIRSALGSTKVRRTSQALLKR